ncbi:MAG: phospho-N-acetylmuramoyl-pentapeptide-transferase [Candidatus Hydrogenedentota bacterium]|nr:MAG: phospho-N-acetylmuramoyl-pentapeptide-transferase [Candidatus Hydrogenedentota bacterium]
MLIYLARYAHILGPLRLFQYLSVRTALAVLISLLVSLLIGPAFIRALKRFSISQDETKEALDFHQHKEGTPTMGGLMVVGVICLSMLFCGNFENRFIPLVLLTTIGLAAIGFIDDYLKLIESPKGLSGRSKILGQLLVALSIGAALYIRPVEAGRLWLSEPARPENGLMLTVPFFKNILLPLGIFYIPLVVLVLIGSSNAVNLTDGLDGLAAGCTLACSVALAGLTYLVGNVKFSSYLNVMYVRGAGELTVFLGAVIGALVGFLWFNTYPAEVFMGDTGSLALGGVLGTVAILAKQELLLVIIGGVFVLEALSVILQVGSYRLRGKRIFRMAPLHHHFELKGWPEPKVIVRFWIMAFVLSLAAVATLKLR